MPWGYLCVLLLNVKIHSNICNLFLYRVCPERIIVYIIEFICVGDVPRYLKAILVGNIIHLRFHLAGIFIFLIQSEWVPQCE